MRAIAREHGRTETFGVHRLLAQWPWATLALTGAIQVGGCGQSGAAAAPQADGGEGDAGTSAEGSAGDSGGSQTAGVNVLEHHLHPQRDGAYVDAAVTKAAAANATLDATFQATITGIVFGHPLYVDALNHPANQSAADVVFVATDHNHVTALNATTGAVLWDQTLGPFVPQSQLPCGQPYKNYGITGTPYIDLGSRTIYVESFQTPDNGATTKHLVYALSIDTGMTLSGWPVDIGAHISSFNSTYQHARGALALLQGTLYVPYAGLNGDCDPAGSAYHGYVVGIDVAKQTVMSWATSAGEGGIWAAVTTDGVSSVFAVTGNTRNATTWSGGEALIRFTQGPMFSGNASDYFAPSTWQQLDTEDADLGSQPALLFDVAGATPSTLAVVGGKKGVVHLVNRADMGGIPMGNPPNGGGVDSLAVTNGNLRGTPATYTSATGRYVVVRSTSSITACPAGTSGNMIALQVTATSPPKLVPAWCADSGGMGSPIATTTDGTSNALVWIVSAQGSNRLLAFDGDTGASVFMGPTGQLGTIQQSTSPIVAKGRFFIGGGNAVYAYKL
jgi:hypothetical protein